MNYKKAKTEFLFLLSAFVAPKLWALRVLKVVANPSAEFCLTGFQFQAAMMTRAESVAASSHSSSVGLPSKVNGGARSNYRGFKDAIGSVIVFGGIVGC